MEQTQPAILFNISNLYFQDTQILQSTLGFVSLLDIDIYVKESFLYTDSQIQISGGDIEAFNKDHLVDERFICYKIQQNNNTPLIASKGMIKFNLDDEGLLSKNMIKNLIQGFPLISFIILGILTLLLPANIAIIFKYISYIGIAITCLFYAKKMIIWAYKTITSKAVHYDDISVQYQENSDIRPIDQNYIKGLKELYTNFNVKEIVLINGICFIKQIITKRSLKETLKGIFVGQKNNEKSEELIQKTIVFLFTHLLNLLPNTNT